MFQDLRKGNRINSNFTLLPLCAALSLEQVEDANFSLNHPNQYFVESQKLLGGGKNVKREVENSQKSQENTAAKGAREVAANSSQNVAEMNEELDSFFID